MSIVVKTFEEVAAELRRQEELRSMRGSSPQGGAKNFLHAATQPVADAYHDMSHAGSFAAETLVDCAKQRPLSTLVFTAAMGFLVGSVISHRQD